MKTLPISDNVPKTPEALDGYASVAIIINGVDVTRRATPRVGRGCYSSQLLYQSGRPDVRIEVCQLAGVTAEADAPFLGMPRKFPDPTLIYTGLTFDLKPTSPLSAFVSRHSHSEDIAGLFTAGVDTHFGSGVSVLTTSSKSLDRVTSHANSLA